MFSRSEQFSKSEDQEILSFVFITLHIILRKAAYFLKTFSKLLNVKVILSAFKNIASLFKVLRSF